MEPTKSISPEGHRSPKASAIASNRALTKRSENNYNNIINYSNFCIYCGKRITKRLTKKAQTKILNKFDLDLSKSDFLISVCAKCIIILQTNHVSQT